MAGVSEYISKVTKAQMKELLIQYQNNMQQKGNPGYYMGKLNEDGTKATLVDGTTVDIITKGLPGTYAPVYMIGGGKGLVDQEEPYTENIDQNGVDTIILGQMPGESISPDFVQLFGGQLTFPVSNFTVFNYGIFSTKLGSIFVVPFDSLPPSTLSSEDLVLEEVRHMAWAAIPNSPGTGDGNTGGALYYQHHACMNEVGDRLLLVRTSYYRITSTSSYQSNFEVPSVPIEVSWCILTNIKFNLQTERQVNIGSLTFPLIECEEESSGTFRLTDSILTQAIGQYYSCPFSGTTNGYFNNNGSITYGPTLAPFFDYGSTLQFKFSLTLDGTPSMLVSFSPRILSDAFFDPVLNVQAIRSTYILVVDLVRQNTTGFSLTSKDTKLSGTSFPLTELITYTYVDSFGSGAAPQDIFNSLYLGLPTFIDLDDNSFLLGTGGGIVNPTDPFGSYQLLVNKSTGQTSGYISSTHEGDTLFTESAMYTNIYTLPQIPFFTTTNIFPVSERTSSNIYLIWSRRDGSFKGVGDLLASGDLVPISPAVSISTDTNYSFYVFKIPEGIPSQDFPTFYISSFARRTKQIKYKNGLRGQYFTTQINTEGTLVNILRISDSAGVGVWAATNTAGVVMLPGQIASRRT